MENHRQYSRQSFHYHKQIQTNKLNVYFSGDSFMLVRPMGQGANTSIFQIKNDIVKAVTWCTH